MALYVIIVPISLIGTVFHTSMNDTALYLFDSNNNNNVVNLLAGVCNPSLGGTTKEETGYIHVQSFLPLNKKGSTTEPFSYDWTNSKFCIISNLKIPGIPK